MDAGTCGPGNSSKIASGPYKRIARIVLHLLNQKGIYEHIGSGNIPQDGYRTIQGFAVENKLHAQTLWGLLWGNNVPRKRWFADFARAIDLSEEESDLLYLISEADREGPRSERVSGRFNHYARIIAPNAYHALVEKALK